MGDATISIERVRKIPVQHQDDMEIDVAGKVDLVELEKNSSGPKDVGVLAGNCNEKNVNRTSQTVGDHNDSCFSSTLPSTASDNSMTTTLATMNIKCSLMSVYVLSSKNISLPICCFFVLFK